MPEQDDDAAELDQAEVVCRVVFPASDEAAKVLQPGEQALDLPAAAVAAERAAILGHMAAVRTVGRDQLDHALSLQPSVQPIAVIRAVPIKRAGGAAVTIASRVASTSVTSCVKSGQPHHGERRTNATHQSTTDPAARLAKTGAGHEAHLAYQGHVLMESRQGLAVAAVLTPATGTAERDVAERLMRGLPRREHRRTLGADKGYDTQGCVAALRALGVTPHVAQHTRGRRSAIDARTTRHGGYTVSQQKRKRVEEIFGWLKTIGLQRQTRFRGTARVGWMFVFATAAYNLVRMHRLLADRRCPVTAPAAAAVGPRPSAEGHQRSPDGPRQPKSGPAFGWISHMRTFSASC